MSFFLLFPYRTAPTSPVSGSCVWLAGWTVARVQWLGSDQDCGHILFSRWVFFFFLVDFYLSCHLFLFFSNHCMVFGSVRPVFRFHQKKYETKNMFPSWHTWNSVKHSFNDHLLCTLPWIYITLRVLQKGWKVNVLFIFTLCSFSLGLLIVFSAPPAPTQSCNIIENVPPSVICSYIPVHLTLSYVGTKLSGLIPYPTCKLGI